MKKSLIGGLAVIGILTSASLKAQPVADHAVIPVAFTLNEIARIHVMDGGNIEFVFNTIQQFKDGIANGATGFYDSQFGIASSTSWALLFGAEDATLIGTEDNANTIALNNVGFNMTHTVSTVNSCCALLDDIDAATTNNAVDDGVAGTTNGLPVFTVVTPLMSWGGVANTSNAGEIGDNTFLINWECGTTVAGGTTVMNAVSFIEQSFTPDRYVTNVFLDLTTPSP